MTTHPAVTPPTAEQVERIRVRTDQVVRQWYDETTADVSDENLARLKGFVSAAIRNLFVEFAALAPVERASEDLQIGDTDRLKVPGTTPGWAGIKNAPTLDANALKAAKAAMVKASGLSPMWGDNVAQAGALAAVTAYLAATAPAERASGRLAPAVEGNAVPHVWVSPGDDTANCNGFVDATAYQEGEFTLPLYRLEDAAKAAITAALIEARRAALDEAASTLDHDLHLQDSEMRGYSRNSAARIRALIPTCPDGRGGKETGE
jgi:hypothetical protein